MIEQDELGEEQIRMIENYNPVTIAPSESIGTIALAVVSMILLFALLRSQRRVRELHEQRDQEAEG